MDEEDTEDADVDEPSFNTILPFFSNGAGDNYTGVTYLDFHFP